MDEIRVGPPPLAAGFGGIFNVLDGVIDLHREGGSATRIAGEIDRLLDITREYFRVEDRSPIGSTDYQLELHLELHRRVVGYILALRRRAHDCEHPLLLAQLRFLDYWLTSDIAEHFAHRA
jgi:hypothetical protein